MDPAQLQPGYRLDRYELLCPLAYGGMASVWLARLVGRLGFERLVVIKMILPQFSQDPRFQEMFLDEARIASKIEHSNVARILDVGEHQENYYIVMEWVDGDSLSKVLRAVEQRKQRVPTGVALRICADAAAGLNAAHELRDRDGTHLGVVHRDVSPQNILIANNGATMIIDFGVAKARDRVSQDTSAGQLKGKIRYMAPEQALGRPIDHRADVWALGAMLYEMFTGNPPYDGPNEVATLHKLTSGQAAPAMPRTLPEVLRAVVERALAYEPDERFSTALELNLALEGAMVEINEPTTAAIVAHYTGQLLAERKGARKRAVDAALDAARMRETTGPHPSLSASGMGPAVAAGGPASIASFQAAAARTMPLITPEASHAPSGSLPGAPTSGPTSGASGMSPINAMNLGEPPSTASSGTMGAAALEYPPADLHFGNDAARRKRYFTAAALGMSVAAGVVGAILIIGATVLKRDEPKPGSSERGAAVSIAPAGSAGTATPTPDEPPPPVEPPASAPPPTTASAAAAASAVAHADPPSTKAAPPPHRPPPPPPPPAKPRTPPPPATAAPASTKPDRGF